MYKILANNLDQDQAPQKCCPGAVFIQLLGWISCLGEDFKSMFLIYFSSYFSEALHAYEKHCFS